MFIANGLLTLYRLENVAEKGNMPRMKLVEIEKLYYSERSISFNRFYTAMGVSQQVDRVVRTWRSNSVVGNYVIIDDVQYRVDVVQHFADDDGLQVTDMTLSRVGDNFDIE